MNTNTITLVDFDNGIDKKVFVRATETIYLIAHYNRSCFTLTFL